MEYKVAGLTSFPDKGEPGIPLTEMNLIGGHGVAGDMHKGGGRQVSLLSSDVQRWRETQPQKGLCFKRFKANILIDGLPDNLKTGDKLRIGDIILRITGSKDCFDICMLRSNNIPCRLSKNAVFAAVEQGGSIRIGDSVNIL